MSAYMRSRGGFSPASTQARLFYAAQHVKLSRSLLASLALTRRYDEALLKAALAAIEASRALLRSPERHDVQ